MLHHHLKTDHAIALSLADFSFWCYKCEEYVDGPILLKYKNLALIDKFSVEATSDTAPGVDQLSNASHGSQCSDSNKQGSSKGCDYKPEPSASGSSGNKNLGGQQAGPSNQQTSDIKQSLNDFLKDQEGFAVEPLKTCPHLATLDNDNTPTCK